MTRIQVLPLPPVKVGEAEQTPFILVLDQLAGERETWHDADIDYLKATTGAALVLAHDGTLDAPGQLELTDEQREQLLAHITQPVKVNLGMDITDYHDVITDPR